jgi:hypothetical protein
MIVRKVVAVFFLLMSMGALSMTQPSMGRGRRGGTRFLRP